MNITLEIKGADLSKEVSTILSELSREEKKQMAKEVMMKWLTEPVDFERNSKVIQCIEELRAKYRSASWESERKKSELSDEQIMASYDFQEKMKGWRSTKEIMVQEIINQSVDRYKKLATRMISNDKQLQEIWEKSKDVIKQNFPKYVHDAMVYFFAGKLQEIQYGIQESVMQAQNAKMHIDEIKRAVGLPQ